MIKSIFSLMASLLVAAPLLSQEVGTVEAPNYLVRTAPITHEGDAPDYIKSAPLWGKTMVIIGDSYVRNHRDKPENGWSYLIAQKYRMQYFNYGRNGNCLVFDRAVWGTAMCRRYVEMQPEADYVLVVAGHNDADYIAGRDLRDSTWTAERQSIVYDSLLNVFRQQLPVFVDDLIRRYPRARLAFVTPWNVDSPGFADVLATLRQVCAEKSVPLYDAASYSGIYVNDPDFRKLYFQAPGDKAHLNADGHRLFMRKMETFLLGL